MSDEYSNGYVEGSMRMFGLMRTPAKDGQIIQVTSDLWYRYNNSNWELMTENEQIKWSKEH